MKFRLSNLSNFDRTENLASLRGLTSRERKEFLRGLFYGLLLAFACWSLGAITAMLSR